MTGETVIVEREGPVGILTLNRPSSLNAMSFQLTGELRAAFEAFESDDEIAVVILTGAGERAFCAGADIKEMADLSDDERQRRNEARRDWLWYVADFSKPTIGAINGLAFGGGALLASAVDIRIGCERSSFRFLAATYGLINSTWTLPLVVGWSRAKELLLTGRLVESAEAVQIGLLNRIVPAAELRSAALGVANQIAGNHAESVRGVKRLLHEGVELGYRGMYDHENDARGTRFRSPTIREGFKDFIARKGI